MRTPAKRKLEQLPNRSTRGLSDELLRDCTPNQLRRAILGDADMATSFRSYPKLLDTFADNPVLGRTFLRFVSDGCAPGVILSLLAACVLLDQIVSLIKKDLDRLKSRFDGLIRRLESLRADVASLGTMRIGDAPLETSFSFREIDDRVGTEFARKYMFTQLPGSLTWAKFYLKELKENPCTKA